MPRRPQPPAEPVNPVIPPAPRFVWEPGPNRAQVRVIPPDAPPEPAPIVPEGANRAVIQEMVLNQKQVKDVAHSAFTHQRIGFDNGRPGYDRQSLVDADLAYREASNLYIRLSARLIHYDSTKFYQGYCRSAITTILTGMRSAQEDSEARRDHYSDMRDQGDLAYTLRGLALRRDEVSAYQTRIHAWELALQEWDTLDNGGPSSGHLQAALSFRDVEPLPLPGDPHPRAPEAPQPRPRRARLPEGLLIDDQLQEQPVAPKEYLPCAERGSATPRFFIHYETAEEYKLRLKGTYILYKNSPIYIVDVRSNGAECSHLLARDVDNSLIQIEMTPDNILHLNSRSIQPGYLDLTPLLGEGQDGYMYRIPGRVYRQGLCSENTKIARLSGTNGLGEFNSVHFLQTLKKRSTKRLLTSDLLKKVNGIDKASPYRSALVSLSPNFAISSVKDKVDLAFRGATVLRLSDSGEFPDSIFKKFPPTFHPEIQELQIVK